MQHDSSFLTQLGGYLAAKTINAWMSTLDYRVAYYDASADPASRDGSGPKIYILWHEYLLFPIYLRGHCDFAMLFSRHRDADLLVRVAYHFGFDSVRGSTYRGAAAAIRQLSHRSRNMNLAITPDGPRGPRRRVAMGSIYLASKLGLPIVAIGIGYDRLWRLSSWDRFAIPKPHARARAVMSPAITIPSGLDREGLERCRLRVEQTLLRLTHVAEDWAVTGRRLEGEQPLRKQTAPLSRHRIDAAHEPDRPRILHPAPVKQAS